MPLETESFRKQLRLSEATGVGPDSIGLASLEEEGIRTQARTAQREDRMRTQRERTTAGRPRREASEETNTAPDRRLPVSATGSE